MARTEILNGLPPVLIAQAAAAAAKPIFGFDEMPHVQNYGDYSEIVLTPAQQDQVAAFIIRQLDAEPGAVRVDLSGVMTRVLSRKYWAYGLGAVAAGAALGSLFTPRRKRK
jgi:pyocin large subunit-like protein